MKQIVKLGCIEDLHIQSEFLINHDLPCSCVSLPSNIDKMTEMVPHTATTKQNWIICYMLTKSVEYFYKIHWVS